VFGELIFALGWESVAAAFRKRSEAHPVLARIGYLLIGLAAGALSGVVFPRRLSQHDGVSALGVLLNPLLFGLLAFLYGDRRRRTERATTHLATFWGGALFAFGLSAARLAVLVLS
jgi:hypothetical protein